jgi:hypothetical protein
MSKEERYYVSAVKATVANDAIHKGSAYATNEAYAGARTYGSTTRQENGAESRSAKDAGMVH